MKKGLGKGLEALLGDISSTEVRGESTLKEIPITEIYPNPYQPRKEFNEEEIESLSRSIKENGILQPIVVTQKEDNKYIIVAGERRWRAAAKAGLKKVPAIIKDVDEKQLLVLALVENINRKDLNPIEEAEGYRVLIEELGYTQEEVARAVGKDRATIANSLRLLKLPEVIKEALRKGKISAGHARAIINLPPEDQIKLLNEIIEKNLSVREVEKKAKEKKVQKEKKDTEKSLLEEMAKEVSLVSGLLVKITGRENRGKVVISYFSKEELDRILNMLRA